MNCLWIRSTLHVLSSMLIAAATHAQIAVYHDRAAFAAAAGPLRAVQTISGPTSSVSSAAPHASLFDVQFDGVCFRRVFNYYNHLVYTYPGVEMRAELPSGTYAVGWTLSLFYPASGSFNIALSNGQVVQVSTPTPFFGIVSSTPIAWIGESFDNTYPVFLGRDYVAQEGFFLTASAGSVASCPLPPNTPPVASAGPDQSIHAGALVSLNGGASFDDNTPTASLGFAWTFASKPSGSAAALSGASTAAASFVADKAGTYRVTLVVTDGAGLQSAPSEVVVSSLNQAPTASAGPDQLAIVSSAVQLNGAASIDPDSDPLSYAWVMSAVPAGSAAQLAAPYSVNPTFQPDRPGTYTITLTVQDPFGQSATDTVDITVTTAYALAEQKILCADALVRDLSPAQVTNRGNQTALSNFLGEALRAVERGQIATALSKLTDAIERTNGCEANPGNPAPDGNGPGRDWVTDCGVQPPILMCLRAARDALSAP